MTRKTKKVRCWMVWYRDAKTGKANYCEFYLSLRSAERSMCLGDRLTPGHFVPDAKKARKR